MRLPFQSAHRWPAPTLLMIALALSSAYALNLGGREPLGSDPLRELMFTWLSIILGMGAIYILATHKYISMKWSEIFILAFVVRLISIQAWPLLEDDFFRYLWDGRQTALTGSPWAHPPEAFFSDIELPQQWQWVLNHINYPELPTLYGPVLQYTFALAYYIKPASLAALQSVLLFVDIAILISLYWMKTPLRWLLAYAIHPLIFKEAMASAHPDLLMALGLLWVMYGWQRQNAIVTGIALGIAMGAKISAIIALPFVLLIPIGQKPQLNLKWSANVIGVCFATLCLLYLPLLQQTGSELFSLSVFAQTWRFNPLLYRIIESVFLPDTARMVSSGCLLISLIALLIYWRQRLYNQLPPIDLAFFLLFLFSPVVNSWYWLWILPLSILLKRDWLVAGSVASTLAYCNSSVLNLPGQDESHQFFVPIWITVLQLMILTGFLAYRGKFRWY